ncbi:Protein CBG06934 [Caenorhabditis briggsae]|uniref:non-specific serine/threonine protein kinase n=1 Tax=Caenorhabditis briggsae TaxID=6238 RepID=A8X3E2_CAEBR|nr:Protein CBG06934 [Caenorhabditis briggsae]CAP27152.2 Protein CBG06934 [Caenorhabditis briggsae]
MSTRLRTKLEPNDIIKRSKTDFNWKVIVQLGVGGFGTVNKVIQINEAGVPINDKEFAMKTELKCAKKQASRLKIERNVMASFAKCAPACKEHFPELIDLGQTLELKAIHDFHILGFLHRDIKPANYCIGAGAKRELIYILDFGLARKYRQKNGQVRAPRNKTKMIGTPRYCPRASHRMEELARKDDFESWYFMLLDFMDGDKGVPWKGQPRETAYALKRKVFDEPKWISTVSRVPAEFGIMAEYLNSLLFNSEVEFGVFREAITDYARGCNLTLKEPLDWMSEMKSLDTTSTSTTMPSTSTLPSTSSTMPSSKIGSSDDNRSIFSEKAEESSIDRSRTGSRSSLNPRGASCLRGATARLDYKDSFQDVDRGLRRRVRNMEYQNEGFPSAPTADPDFDLKRILWNDSDEEKSTFTTSNESIDVSDIRTS